MQEERKKPTMPNAEQGTEKFNMSKGYAYKIVRQMSEEQEALGRPVVRGRVRSDHSSRVMKMLVYKNENGAHYAQCFYRDGRGTKNHNVKRGFETELDTLTREKDFRSSHLGTMDMTSKDFVEV